MSTANSEPECTERARAVHSNPRLSVLAVAEGYERWAASYDRAPNPLLAREERRLLPMMMDLERRRILDLACGTGRWLERLAAPGGHQVVGIDASIAMLRLGSAKSSVTGRLAQASCENLPFGPASFNLAICSFALGHFRDLQSTALELARVTAAEGDLFISDLHPEAYTRGWRVGFRENGAAYEIEMLPRSADEIAHAFSRNGFQCRTIESLRLGQPEEETFARAGKSAWFAESCQVPAVIFCHFTRLNSGSAS